MTMQSVPSETVSASHTDDDLAGRLQRELEPLRNEFRTVADAATIEQCLREAVDALQDARIPDFVPLFAYRDARRRLLTLAGR